MSKEQRKGIVDPDFIVQLLQDCVSQCSPQERLKLLKTCIDYGNDIGMNSAGADVFVFIGNSGSGKSTVVNFLSGCDFLEENGSIRVKTMEEGGKMAEVTPIGHGSNSSTVFVNVIKASQRGEFFCDCPGFNDTRGLEINIGNAISLKKVLVSANRLKVFALINHHSLDAERGKGLHDFKSCCLQLFGSLEMLQRYKKSILFGISHVLPFCAQNKQQFIREIVKDSFLHEFQENIVLVDPLSHASYIELTDKLDTLEWVTNPTFFQICLTPEDESGLLQLLSNLLLETEQLLQQEEMSTAVDGLHHFLKVVSLLEHKSVVSIAAVLEQAITIHLKALLEQLNTNFLFDFEKTEDVIKNLDELLLLVSSDTCNKQKQFYKLHIEEAKRQFFFEKTKQVGLFVLL